MATGIKNQGDGTTCLIGNPMRAIIELQDVWKIYLMGEFDVPALQGIDITIKQN